MSTTRIEVQLLGHIATLNGARVNYIFNVEDTMSVGVIIARVRSNISMDASQGIFAFHTDDKGHMSLSPMSATCSSIARDGVLKLTMTSENAFGGGDDSGVYPLPVSLMRMVFEYLMPTIKLTRRRMAPVCQDIRVIREIWLPEEDYNVRDVVRFVNEDLHPLLKKRSTCSARWIPPQ